MNLVHKNKRNGFTVLELMVVIGIMVMMLILTIPNFRSFDRTQILEIEADKIFSLLRQAQVWALTGQTVNNTRYNYGLHFNICNATSPCSYSFFKDNDGDKRYDSGPINEEYDIGRVNLNSGVYISSIFPNSSGLDIIFEAPSGMVYVNGLSQADFNNATTTLTSSLSSKIRTITINGSSGQINIK